jgi:MFS family permease
MLLGHVISICLQTWHHFEFFVSGGLITGVFASLVIVPRQYLLSHNYEYIARRRTIRRAIIGGIFLVGYIGGGLYLLFNHVDMEAVCQWCEYLSCLPIFEYCIEFHNSNNNNYNSNKNNVVPSPSQR